MKKILIIYTSVGLGHKVVAENIAQALKKYPGLNIKLLDILEFFNSAFFRRLSTLYLGVLKHLPWLWEFFYTNRVFHKLILPLRLPLASLRAKKLQRYLEDEEPDLVLTTQTTATALLSYLRQRERYQGLLVTTFSDFHFQPFWVYPRVDRYLVMTPEQQQEVAKLGFAKERIVVTGLPVDEEFTKDYEEGQFFHEFNLSHVKPLILVMGGSRGLGIKPSDIQALLNSSLDFQIAVITGTNEALKKRLEAIPTKDLKVFGSLPCREVAKLFAIARILVSKPGGLTVAQAIVRNLPMILVNPFPAMEEANLSYLLGRGIGVYAKNSQELRAWVERLLLDLNFYQKTKENIKRLNFEDSAKKAAEAIIDML